MEVGAWEPKIPIRSNGSGSCGGILDRSLEALEANGQTSWFIDQAFPRLRPTLQGSHRLGNMGE